MSQVTIYLDKETEKRVKRAAKKSKLSVSRWFLQAAEKELLPQKSKWPTELLASFGTWTDEDFPDAEELRRPLAEDLPRESL